jgi:hypothetical protein
VKVKGQARNRLTGIRTRGSPGPDEVARIIWGIDVFVSRRSALRLVNLIGFEWVRPRLVQGSFQERERPSHWLDSFSYLSCVFAARSASVSQRSAISMKYDLCAELRAASANRMHSAALLRN